MKTKLLKSLITRFPCPDGQHLSFLMRKSRILSIGKNKKTKSHPLADKFKYHWNTIHSELDAILKAESLHGKLTMINIRKTEAGAIGLAKPCTSCRYLLAHFGVRKIFYTDNFGNFIEEDI